jgi:hypothetical protein
VPRGQSSYAVTVHTASGSILTRLDLVAGDVEAVASGNASMSTTVALPCGTVRLSFGRTADTPLAVAFAELPPCT